MSRATIEQQTKSSDGSAMQDLNDLYLFTLVVDNGSFTAASQVAGLTTSRISRRIADLEERLGVRLLHRTTRKLALTAIGELYYRHCKAMVSEAQAAAEVVEQMQASPRGRVRVTCPVLTGPSVLGPIITEFMQSYPEVQISLAATDRLVDLIDEGFDVAIRIRAMPMEDSGLVARPVGESLDYLVASPKFIAKHGHPAQPDDLLRLSSVGKSHRDAAYNWYLTDTDGRTSVIPYQPILESDDWLVLKQAVIAGIGITSMPAELCQQDVTEGRLEILLPEWKLPSTTLYIVYTSRRGLIPAVRLFIDFVAERLSRRYVRQPRSVSK